MRVRNVPLDEAGPLARDVMLSAPETIAASVSVAQARPLLESPRLRMLLVTDEDGVVGSVSRERLESETDGDVPLGRIVDADAPRVRPDEAVTRILELLEANDTERLPVVDTDGRLVGLICFNRRKRHFCVDEAQA